MFAAPPPATRVPGKGSGHGVWAGARAYSEEQSTLRLWAGHLWGEAKKLGLSLRNTPAPRTTLLVSAMTAAATPLTPHQRQARWLLLMKHTHSCSRAPNCGFGQHCVTAHAFMRHAAACADDACAEPRCVATRQLLAHHSTCALESCPNCVPARAAVHAYSQDVPPAADG